MPPLRSRNAHRCELTPTSCFNTSNRETKSENYEKPRPTQGVSICVFLLNTRWERSRNYAKPKPTQGILAKILYIENYFNNKTGLKFAGA